MTFTKTTLLTATLALTTLGACEMATDGNFDAEAARLDLTLDTNNDGNVTDDEIIDGNMARFDTNGDGILDAVEREQAEDMLVN